MANGLKCTISPQFPRESYLRHRERAREREQGKWVWGGGERENYESM